MIPIKKINIAKNNSSTNSGGATFVGGGSSSTTIVNATLDKHTIWGQEFDGTNDVSGDLNDVKNINAKGGDVTVKENADGEGGNIYADGVIEAKKELKSPLTTTDSIVIKDVIKSEDFTEGSNGLGVYKDNEGNWHLQAEYLNVTKKLQAEEVEILHSSHIGGKLMNTAANLKIVKVEETADGYKCYFLKKDKDNIVYNMFVVDDLAYCETFNLVNINGVLENHFYWRRVIEVDDNTDEDIEMHYVVLSKTDCASGSNVPKINDEVVQLGNKTVTDRQGAIIQAAVGSGTPYIRLYKGINSYNLPKPTIDLNPSKTSITADEINLVNPDTNEVKNITDVVNGNNAAIDEIKNGLLQTGINITNNTITTTSDKLIMQDKNGNPHFLFEATDDGVKSKFEINADKINFIGQTIINNKFVVDENGNVVMNNASVTGEINANKGSIGNLVIDENGAFVGGNQTFTDIDRFSPHLPFNTTNNEDLLKDIIKNFIIANYLKSSVLVFSADNALVNNSNSYDMALPNRERLKLDKVLNYGFPLKLISIMPRYWDAVGTAYVPNPNMKFVLRSNPKIWDENVKKYVANGEICENNGKRVDYIEISNGDVLELYHIDGRFIITGWRN